MRHKILFTLIVLCCSGYANAQSLGLGSNPWLGVQARTITATSPAGVPAWCDSGSGHVLAVNEDAGSVVPTHFTRIFFCDHTSHWRPFASWQSISANAGGSATIDFLTGPVQKLNLTASITTLTLDNVIDGAHLSILFTQTGTGGWSVAWPTAMKWPSGVAPTLSLATGKTDVVNCVTVGSTLYCSALLDVR